MDTARLAAMSDPCFNPQFSRKWNEGPPERKRPPMPGSIKGATFKYCSSEKDYSDNARILQAAFRLDRAADAELAIGRVKVAERLAHEAQELREVYA